VNKVATVPRVLLVDDDKKLLPLLERGFRFEGLSSIPAPPLEPRCKKPSSRTELAGMEPSHDKPYERGSVAIRTIVGGLLVMSGTVLLGKRAPTRTLAPNVWDVFGGRVESGESAEAALVRELGEELGIQAKHFTMLDVLDDPQRPDGAFTLFLVDGWDGVPHNHCPEEHTEIRWFSLGEVERIPLAHPAYSMFCRRILPQQQSPG
jgi:8-oxo-dGTP diphosphatase